MALPCYSGAGCERHMTRDTAIDVAGGWTLHAHDSLGSTNDEARRLAAEGAPHGTVVTARRQTAGRGRLGRSWSSPPGNLYASFLLRPGVPAARASELGFVAAVAVAESCDALLPPRQRVSLKWPNDVLLDGAKLAGILAEMTDDGVVVVGIGLNVEWAPDGLPYSATDLCAHAHVSVGAALQAVADAMARRMAGWQVDGFDPVRHAWMARGPARGAPLAVRIGAAQFAGRYAGLDECGALLLDGEAGCRRFVAGEVVPGTPGLPVRLTEGPV